MQGRLGQGRASWAARFKGMFVFPSLLYSEHIYWAWDPQPLEKFSVLRNHSEHISVAPVPSMQRPCSFQHWVEGVSPRNAAGMCRKVVTAQRVLDLLSWPKSSFLGLPMNFLANPVLAFYGLYFAASGSQHTSKVKDFPQILDLKFKSKTHKDEKSSKGWNCLPSGI